MHHFGKYAILGELGVGGMAKVFKARLFGLHGFEKTLALKIIDPQRSGEQEFVDLFIREATLAARLDHDNIVRIFDFDQIEGVYYIAMEYVDGSNLRGLLNLARKAGSPIQVAEAVAIASGVCQGLAYAHGEVGNRPFSVVHSDISPSNILISRYGEVKIADFGIAMAEGAAEKSQPGVVRGKVSYMSPEQTRAEPLDKRTDIFSFGCVLWELCTGQKLFEGDSDAEIIEKVRNADITPPSALNQSVPVELDELVLAALEHDREKRTVTASYLVNGLHEIMDRLGEKAAPSVILERMTARLLPPREHTTTITSSVVTNPRPEQPGSLPGSLPPGFAKKEVTVLDRPGPDVKHPPVSGTNRDHLGNHMVLATDSLPSPNELAILAASQPLETSPSPLPHVSPALPHSRRSRGLYWAFGAALLVLLGVSVGVIWSRLSENVDPHPGEAVFSSLKDNFPVHQEAVSPPEISNSAAPANSQTSPSASASPEPSYGWLYLNSLPAAEVYLGNKKLDETPVNGLRLPAGRHWLRLVNEPLGLEKSILVEIPPGKRVKRSVELRE